jgi:hypothetical protein
VLCHACLLLDPSLRDTRTRRVNTSAGQLAIQLFLVARWVLAAMTDTFWKQLLDALACVLGASAAESDPAPRKVADMVAHCAASRLAQARQRGGRTNPAILLRCMGVGAG